MAMMKIKYNDLWKVLIDKNMNTKDLMEKEVYRLQQQQLKESKIQ